MEGLDTRELRVFRNIPLIYPINMLIIFRYHYFLMPGLFYQVLCHLLLRKRVNGAHFDYCVIRNINNLITCFYDYQLHTMRSGFSRYWLSQL